jgi:hypothetical protein
MPRFRVREAASRRNRLGPPFHRGALRPADVPEGHKGCPECGETELIADFPRNRAQRSGVGTYCKPCHNRIVYENKERHGGARNYHSRRRYGITAEHFDQMFAEQDGLCKICQEAPASHVDHDHATGRVRGLLCFNCNGALGQFRDRTDLIMRAVAYLRRGAWGELIDNPGLEVGFFPYGSHDDSDDDGDEPPEARLGRAG